MAIPLSGTISPQSSSVEAQRRYHITGSLEEYHGIPPFLGRFFGKMMMNHLFKGTLFPDRPISRFWFLKIHEDVSFMKRTFKRMLFFDSDRFLA